MKKFSTLLVSLLGILLMFCMIGCSDPTGSSTNKPSTGDTNKPSTGDTEKPAPTDFTKLLTITVEGEELKVGGTHTSKIAYPVSIAKEVTLTFKNISDKDIAFGKFDTPTNFTNDSITAGANTIEIKARPGDANMADGTYVLKSTASSDLKVSFSPYANGAGKKGCLKIPLVINGENADVYYAYDIRAKESNKQLKMVMTRVDDKGTATEVKSEVYDDKDSTNYKTVSLRPIYDDMTRGTDAASKRIEKDSTYYNKYTYTLEFTTDSANATFTDSIKESFETIFKKYNPEITNTKLKATMPPETLYCPDDATNVNYKRQINANDSKGEAIVDIVKAEDGTSGKYLIQEIWWYLANGSFVKQ